MKLCILSLLLLGVAALPVARSQLEREGPQGPVVTDDRGPTYSIDGSNSQAPPANENEVSPPHRPGFGPRPSFPFGHPFFGGNESSGESPFGTSLSRFFESVHQRFEEMAQRMREQMLQQMNATQSWDADHGHDHHLDHDDDHDDGMPDLAGAGSTLNGEPVPPGTNVTKEEIVTIRGRQFIKRTKIINKDTPHGHIFLSSVSYEPYNEEESSPATGPASESSTSAPTTAPAADRSDRVAVANDF